MKVYTKKGDTGTTQLIGGARVPKHHLRIACYGTVDELNAFTGMVCDQLQDPLQQTLLREIQDRLFTIGSSLASDPAGTHMILPDLKPGDLLVLEKQMDEWQAALPELRSFVLPGGHLANSTCHVARCVCRRAERLVSELQESEKVDPLVLSYLNRLSDFYFVLSRKISADRGAEEITWKPRS